MRQTKKQKMWPIHKNISRQSNQLQKNGCDVELIRKVH